MERNILQKSIKIETPENNRWLDSSIVSFLDELSSKFYFWVDKNIITRGNYDINNDNGLIINTLAHAVFKLRKAVPSAKELYNAGYFNLAGLAKIGYEYLKSFLDSNRIQSFQDEYKNEYYALNLHLTDPSIESLINYIQNTEQQIEIVLGNCSKGHLQHEVKNLTDVHGVAITYMNGCQTLSDRTIRLRGERRDKHITRFKGPTTIEGNPISRMINVKL